MPSKLKRRKPYSGGSFPSPSTKDGSKSFLRALGPLVPLIAVVSLANVASQLSLYPLYGGTVASMHFQTVSLAVCMLASFIPFPVSMEKIPWTALSVIIPASPTLLYRAGAQTASWNNSLWGPIVTQTISSIPIQLLACLIIIARTLPFPSGRVPSLYARPIVGFVSWLAFVRVEQVWWDYLFLRGVSSCNLYIFVTLGVSLPTAILSISGNNRFPTPPPSLATSWMRRVGVGSAALHLAIPFIISVVAQSSSPCSTPPFPYIAASNTLRVLDRQHSITGMLVVAESLTGGFRFLRCDHSLLGGRWFYPGTDQQALIDEPIFSAFSLQMAVRLVERSTTRQNQRVLNIGLGIGVSVESFIKHKIHTTVVEIDPVVYRFARQYFGLSQPDEVYIADARKWVHNRAMSIPIGAPNSPKGFDLVVHDCFSGDGVPQHIFTREFWAELQTIMEPDGVLAVNYVGGFTSPAARSVLVTLLSSFRSCRVFHSENPPEDASVETPILNMVSICTSMKKLVFRPATEEDYLGSLSARLMLKRLQDREVDLKLILGNTSSAEYDQWALTDDKNNLGELQRKDSIAHFSGTSHAIRPSAGNVEYLLNWKKCQDQLSLSGIMRNASIAQVFLARIYGTMHGL